MKCEKGAAGSEPIGYNDSARILKHGTFSLYDFIAVIDNFIIYTLYQLFLDCRIVGFPEAVIFFVSSAFVFLW